MTTWEILAITKTCRVARSTYRGGIIGALERALKVVTMNPELLYVTISARGDGGSPKATEVIGMHDLDSAEKIRLRLVNQYLEVITEKHATWCDCMLCEARMLTDVQEEESYHVKCYFEGGEPEADSPITP